MNKILTKTIQTSKEIVQKVHNIQFRCLTSQQNEIKKSVFISQSQDVYTNLALEDWLYKNNDFAHHQILMLWQNSPCVVIGRHQNPWEEVNFGSLQDRGICLARRSSGGGTVYHDIGNLNLTFFTSKKHYDRKYNLELITRAVFKEYGLELTVTPKFDILCQENKVSFFFLSILIRKIILNEFK